MSHSTSKMPTFQEITQGGAHVCLTPELTEAYKPVIDKLAAFIRSSKPRLPGFGIESDIQSGSMDSWSGWLHSQITGILNTLRVANCDKTSARLFHQCDFLTQTLYDSSARFSKVKRRLVPLETKLSMEAGRPDKAVPVLMGHDLYFLGIWLNNTYTTALWDHLLQTWGSLKHADRWIVHFYALLDATQKLAARYLAGDLTCLASRPPLMAIEWEALCAMHESVLSLQPSLICAETIQRKLGVDCTAWKIKSADGPSERSESLSTTLQRIEPVMTLAGITRVPDVGALDITGIPAFQCIRPDAQWDGQTFTVFGGKGETALQCKVSAIAEGIERYCAEEQNGRDKIIAATFKALSESSHVIHPRQFNMPASVPFRDDEVLEWVSARNLADGTACYVPANTVFYPYAPQTGRTLFRYFTTGLAAGNDYIEAIAHGMAEVIERDASALNRILRDSPSVDLASIDSARARDIIEKLRDADINVIVRYIAASDIGVPAFSVILEDRANQDPLFVSGGYSANPNKELALINALTEAALSRVGTISGAREDLAKFQQAKQGFSYQEFKKRYHYWFNTNNAVSYEKLPSFVFPTTLNDLAFMADRVYQAGLRDILWVDLSKGELVLPVVKVLVPGVERYSFKMTCVGKRARKMYRALYGQALRTA